MQTPASPISISYVAKWSLYTANQRKFDKAITWKAHAFRTFTHGNGVQLLTHGETGQCDVARHAMQ